MPPRKRTKPENKALPQRWEWHGRQIVYQIPPRLAGHPAFEGRKRRYPLGRSLTEAHRTWARIQERFDEPRPITILPDLVAAYRLEKLPELAVKTQTEYTAALGRLEGAFQEFRPGDIEPRHAYAYVDANLHRLSRAKHEIRVLSALLSFAVKKGKLRANPLIDQVRFNDKKYQSSYRAPYVSDEQVCAAMEELPRKWQLYMLLKLKTGQDKKTLLLLRRSDLTDEGINWRRAKTDKAIPMEWDDPLRGIIDEILRLPEGVKSDYLFSNRKGQPYYDEERGTASGFDTMWQRMNKRLRARGIEPFPEKVLRHKAASDNPLEAATKALGHSDPRITERIYRVKPDRIKPLKGL